MTSVFPTVTSETARRAKAAKWIVIAAGVAIGAPAALLLLKGLIGPCRRRPDWPRGDLSRPRGRDEVAQRARQDGISGSPHQSGRNPDQSTGGQAAGSWRICRSDHGLSHGIDILLPLSLTLAGRRPGRGRILLRYVMRYVVASAGSCHDALTSGEESAQANERCPRSKILIAPTTSA